MREYREDNLERDGEVTREREREKLWESRRAEKYEGGEQIERIKIKCTS